jgi:anti-sigma B factor antagonist
LAYRQVIQVEHYAATTPRQRTIMKTAGAPGRLVLEFRLDRGIAVAKAIGEVDVSTCGVLREGLLRVVTDEERRGLVVNLAGVTFMDSTGIGVLVGVWHRVRANSGGLAVAVPSPQVRRTLDTAGLAKILPVYDSEAEALHAVRQLSGT